MSEGHSNRMDTIKETATIAVAQANLSDQLAQLIWRATPSDISLGLVESNEEIMSNLSGPESKETKEESKESTIISYLNEVERAVYGDTNGHPDNGSINHFKAAENYALSGNRFLDFPQDLSSCFSSLSTNGNSMVSIPFAATNPPPGFDRPARAALYQRRQAQPSPGTPVASGSSSYGTATITPSGSYNISSQQQQQQQPSQRQPQTQRQAAGSDSSNLSTQNSANVNVNENASSILFQKLLNQQQQQPQASNAAPQSTVNEINHFYQQLLACNLQQQQQQQQNQTASSAAAAAAIIYANLELQQVHLRQYQLQQQFQQQQQQLPRPPRVIYGVGSGVVPVPSAAKESPQTSQTKK